MHINGKSKTQDCMNLTDNGGLKYIDGNHKITIQYCNILNEQMLIILREEEECYKKMSINKERIF